MHFCFPIFDQPNTVATDALDSKVGTWHHTRYRIHGIDQQTCRAKSGTPDVTSHNNATTPAEFYSTA
jgi:hypothetical protein